MFGASGPWAAYGFREIEKDAEDDKHASPIMELGFEETQNRHKGHRQLVPNPRLERQKGRVLGATVKRMISQRIQLQRDLLRGLDKDYVSSVFHKDHLLDPEYLELQSLNEGTIKSDQDDASLISYSRLPMRSNKEHAATKTKTLAANCVRPRSAVTFSRLPTQPRRNSASFRGAIQSRTGDPIARVQSAPVGRRRKPSPKRANEENEALKDMLRHTRSGCEFCPVDCRQVTNSAWRPTSSTGLQAVSGPNHYQYYNYDRYIKYQRPKSAIGQRREYLERTGRSRQVTPKFTNIVSSCRFHPKERKTSPDNRSVRSSPSPERPATKDAWTEDTQFDIIDTEEDRKSNEDEKSQEEEAGLDEWPERTYDDEHFNTDMRIQAEAAYDQAKIEELQPKQQDTVTRVPTPTPISSRSASPTENSAELGKLFETIPKYTDMLTGRVAGSDNEDALSASDHPPDAEDYSVIRVEIRTPSPLPVRRIPTPEVQIVDIVEPRQDLVIHEPEDDYYFERGSEDEEDPLLVDDVEGNVADNKGEESDIEIQFKEPPEEIDSAPISILKPPSIQRERSPSRVTFQFPEEDNEIQNEDESDDIAPVTIAAEDEKIQGDSENKDAEVPPLPIEVEDEESDVPAAEPEPEPQPVRQVTPPPEPSPPKVTVFRPVASKQQTVVIETPKKVEVQPPVLLYEEPTDEALRKLLQNPDLGDFTVPASITRAIQSAIPKKKKSKGSLKGKKKKKGGKKKKVVKENKKEEEESLFTYDPKALDPVEMARQNARNRQRDKSDLISVMASVKEFEERMKNKPWLFGRMALSKQVCRFWLPMDLRELEGVSPSQYLSQYCFVCKRRNKFYTKAFENQLLKRKSKDNLIESNKTTLDVKETAKALQQVHAGCISDEQIAFLRDLVCLDAREHAQFVSRANCKLFAALCGFSERLFYSQFVTEDTEESENSHRKRIEAADFDGLDWRLRDVKVSPELRRLLFTL